MVKLKRPKKIYLSLGLRSDSTKTQIINQDGWHVAYIEIDPSEQIAHQIITSVNSYNKLVNALKTVREDCQMALDGTWDKSDEGFKDTITFIEQVLEECEA